MHALTVEPSITDLSAVPAKQSAIRLTIANPQAESIKVRIEFADLSYSPDGLPLFSTAGALPDSIISWLSTEKAVIPVGPGAAVEVTFHITVPANAAPGGHYGAIVLSSDADITTGNPADISVVPKVAALLYLDVAGNVKREVSIASFEGTRKIVLNGFPVSFSLNLKNTGTVHIQPHGVVQIYNAWTSQLLGTLILNEDSAYMLPKNNRMFSLGWNESSRRLYDPRVWGLHRAVAELGAMGTSRQTATTYYWMLPYKYMLIDAVAVIVAYILLKNSVRAVRSFFRKRKKTD